MMSISLLNITIDTPNRIQLLFSEPFNQNSELYKKDNYVFNVRFGTNIQLYTKLVEVFDTVTVVLTLQDAMLTDGNYEVTVSGVSALSDNIRIENGSGNRTLQFVGDGDPKKTFSIKKKVPQWWNTSYGSNLHTLLGATGEKLEELVGESSFSNYQEAIKSLFIRTAVGEDLSLIGQNYGIKRPSFLTSDDDLYRKIIPLFATKKKSVLEIFYAALIALYGPQSTAHWHIFVINSNEVIVEIPQSTYLGIAAGNLTCATYLHTRDYGTSTSVGLKYLTDTSKNWSSNSWAGLYKLIDSGSNVFTINSNTTNTLTLASGTPASGFYRIEAHYTPSYPGDYFLADATIAGSSIDGHNIFFFQQNILEDILKEVKAAGIKITVETFG
jgi:hypothetical protein